MSVDAIMTRDVVSLRPDNSVSTGLRIMHERHRRSLPVVDDSGNFLGLFGVRQVVHLLLPKAAQIDFGLTNLSFMPDDLGDLLHRLHEVGEQPVTDFLEPPGKLLKCTPATPLPELLELLHQSFNTSLPVIVVEGDSDRLVGMVSSWDVLEKLVINVFGNPADVE